MKIKQILSQHRRDLRAVYECDHCGHSHEASGYDDDYFHNTVIPSMPCPECQKTASENYVPNETKYPAGMVL
jgi:predicted RNA-binding Zn-ribbon protein involved in translation (DUF1610 family)